MIKDYRIYSDNIHSRMPKRLLTHAAYSLLALGIGVAVYETLGHAPSVSLVQTPSDKQESPQREIIELTLPSLNTGKNKPEERGEPPASALIMDPPGTENSPVTSDNLDSTDFSRNKTEPDKALPTLPLEVNTETAKKEFLASDQQDTEQNIPLENEVRWLEETVEKGDSISKIFSRMNLSAKLLHRIINSSNEAKQLARIRPGETLKVNVDGEGNFLGLILERNAIKSLNIQAKDDEFRTRTIERGLETRIASASGTIASSLYQGAQRAGLSDELTMELANIFGWDIDFALEIRAGDHFSLVYEEEYLDGEHYGSGSILAAEFVNRGTVFRAVRYRDKEGNNNYFSPDGRSMRKAFLRAPVDFRRISSRFTKARWHPVLGKKRPHKGVDYAAATGTPIKAAGDGRVIFRGRKGGYGKTVIIQHGNQYTTLYGHMSSYKRSVKSGSRVKQGQVIGYVGKTGLATGPHLHYEFRVNGVHRNPLTIKIPAASPINKQYKADFEQKSKPLLAQLDIVSRTQVATAE